jgi:hypothetical protein
MNETETLKQQVADLMAWKADMEKQLIKYPIDAESVKVLNLYFPRIVSDYKIVAGAGGNVFNDYILRQDTRTFFGQSTERSLRYTVDASSNVFTLVGGQYLLDGTHVYFSTSDTAPDPIDTLTGDYYIISASTNTFKISETLGGAEVDITDSGTGQQYIGFY